ncbi:MAG TPA: glycosyltransferase family 1 protein [Fibrobacteraceae bacterium]|nr:glycosyltransferase family 1 protein [Fibrobacteraceae bacterium]
MRIAINASILGNQPTGTNIYTMQVLKRLLRLPQMQDHAVDVFTPEPLELAESIRQILLPENIGRNAARRGNALRRFWWNQTQFARLARDYDRVYCPTYNTALRVPDQIITIHDLLALRYPGQHRAQNLYCRWSLPVLLRHAHRIIAVSQTTRSEILENYDVPPERIVVIPNGFDPERFSINSGPRDKGVLASRGLERYWFAVGATFPHKNLEVVLRALVDLPGDSLAIAGGDNPYLRSLRRLALALRIQDRVRFLGYVPDEELPALYRGALALVYPSLFEGFGLPILEAMGCGCPVVCSRTPSLYEVGGDAARYCLPDDPQAWVMTLGNLQNPPERALWQQKGLQRVPFFSWDVCAQAIAEQICSRS